jgi:ribose transport system ATP-binding protein
MARGRRRLNVVMMGALRVSPIVATIATLGIVQGMAILLRPEPAGLVAPELGTLR